MSTITETVTVNLETESGPEQASFVVGPLLRHAVQVADACRSSDASRPALTGIYFEAWNEERVLKVTATDSYCLVTSVIGGSEPNRDADIAVIVETRRTELKKAVLAKHNANGVMTLTSDGLVMPDGQTFGAAVGFPEFPRYRGLIPADRDVTQGHAAAFGYVTTKRLGIFGQSADKHLSSPIVAYPAANQLKPWLWDVACSDPIESTFLAMPVRRPELDK